MHYHSTCLGCLTTDERALLSDDVDNVIQTPGGTAFSRETEAKEDAAYENNAAYMKNWTGHKQVVVPCMSMHCNIQRTAHRLW